MKDLDRYRGDRSGPIVRVIRACLLPRPLADQRELRIRTALLQKMSDSARGRPLKRLSGDVRILDANTGDVLDSVSVSKALNDSTVGVAGTAAFASTVASMNGRTANPMTPDVNYQSSHKESIDKALRACIETSVLALIKRVDLSANSSGQ